MGKNIIAMGGLGNQMFQYALLLALRNKGISIHLDISYYTFLKMHNGYELNRVFGINENCIDKHGFHLYFLRTLYKFHPNRLVLIDKYKYNDMVFSTTARYIFGYWQNERYFKDIEELVRKAFSFANVDDRNKSKAQIIKNQNSISLHIRRGDYREFGMNIIGKDYYLKAISYINKRVENPLFYVFSDDKDEALDILKGVNVKFEIVDWNTGLESFMDMYLMSNCKHHIIANSSFSWWGAWLNDDPNKIVVAPKEWSPVDGNSPQIDNWVLF